MESIYNLPILIVDDNQSNILLIKIFLEQKGFTNLSSANHATPAIEHLQNMPCSLVLLDMLMPDTSGLEMLEMMKQDMSFITPATIFVTALVDEETLGECFEHGAVDFIRKPLDSGIELIARLTHALNNILLEKENSKQLKVDALSHLYNRRHFDDVFEEVYTKSLSVDKTFHLLMLDIDNFKQYNDNYGHPAGDLVIQAVSSSLKDSVKSLGNLVFRLGGEEFAGIFSTSRVEDVSDIMDNVCKDIEALSIPHALGLYPVVTVSAGHLSTTKKNLSFKELYETCDTLLYEAKSAGKNRVVCKKL